MTKMRTYQCPSCSGQFDYLHHPNVEADPPPRYCPLCGFDTESDDDGLQAAITAPILHLKGVARNVDNIFRAEQEGAKFRADLTGESSLNVTNQRDNLRTGDMAAMPVVNDISRAMDASPVPVGFRGGAEQGLAASQMAHNFPDPRTGRVIAPNAGAKTMNAVRNMHPTFGGATTDRPALETQQPGYRRRG